MAAVDPAEILPGVPIGRAPGTWRDTHIVALPVRVPHFLHRREESPRERVQWIDLRQAPPGKPRFVCTAFAVQMTRHAAGTAGFTVRFYTSAEGGEPFHTRTFALLDPDGHGASAREILTDRDLTATGGELYVTWEVLEGPEVIHAVRGYVYGEWITPAPVPDDAAFIRAHLATVAAGPKLRGQA